MEGPGVRGWEGSQERAALKKGVGRGKVGDMDLPEGGKEERGEEGREEQPTRAGLGACP